MQRIETFVLALSLSWPVTAVAQPAAVTAGRDVTQAEDVQRPRKRRVDCDRAPAGSLQKAISMAAQGDTILVSGTCQENVIIPLGKDLITLDGADAAAIAGPDATQPTLSVRARDITIRALTITGGFDGISVSQGASGFIDGNIIHNTARYGVGVAPLSSAVIVNNRIHDNGQAGIIVGMNSSASIGFVAPSDTVARPNVITGNGAQGIVVTRNSYARIVGNEISNNRANGVNVREVSDAEISDNIVNGNGANGILVAQGSGVLLGADTGNTIFTRPNTTTINNVGFGIRCQIAGFADGLLGSLNGDGGPQDYLEGCINSLIP